jgi:hypothetical protein
VYSLCIRIVRYVISRLELAYNAVSLLVWHHSMVKRFLGLLVLNYVMAVPCAVRAAYRLEIRENSETSDQVYFHIFCPKHIKESRHVQSNNSLGLEFMRRRKRKFSGEVDSGSSKKSAKSRMLILPTKLNESQKLLLEKFCNYFQASVKHSFSKSVTHILTNCMKKDGGNLKTRTTKLQFGIVTGKWIMCFDCKY